MTHLTNLAAYCASKAGLSSFARSMARAEARNGIRINILAPGIIYNDMALKAFCKGQSLATQ